MSADAPIRRAIAALRAGRAVAIDGEVPIAVLAVETATAELLEILDPKRQANLLISGARGAALALANLREAADPAEPVLIERASWLDPAAALAIVDPARDFERGPMGPLQPIPLTFPAEAPAALQLARAAGLLPALWVVDARERGDPHHARRHQCAASPASSSSRAPSFRSTVFQTRRSSPFGRPTMGRIMSLW